MRTVIEIVTVAVEVIFLLIYLNGLFSRPKKAISHSVAVYGLFGVVLAALSLLNFPPLIRLAYCIIAAFLISLSLYKIKWLYALYASLVYFVLVVIADILCSVIIGWFGMPVGESETDLATRAFLIITAKLVHLIGIRISISAVRRNRGEADIVMAIPLIVGQVLSIPICYQLFVNARHVTSGTMSVVTVLEMVGMLYLNIIICFYVETIKASYEDKRIKELAEQQLSLQLAYYDKAAAEREATRAMWHDIKKYLNAMRSLVGEQSGDQAVQCLGQAEDAFAKIDSSVDVGNAVVNGILEYGLQKARRTGAELHFDVWVSPELFVSPIDLNVIMCNTIDNAVDECGLIHDPAAPKKIALTLRQQNNMLLYEIKNPSSGKTAKKQGHVHGYGLKNVRNCIEKYQGAMVNGLKEGDYVVSIHLSAP